MGLLSEKRILKIHLRIEELGKKKENEGSLSETEKNELIEYKYELVRDIESLSEEEIIERLK